MTMTMNPKLPLYSLLYSYTLTMTPSLYIHGLDVAYEIDLNRQLSKIMI